MKTNKNGNEMQSMREEKNEQIKIIQTKQL